MRMRKCVAAVLACILCLGCFSAAFAQEAGERRVGMGADLSEAERAQIYRDFGIAPGTVPEVVVTNADERAYLLNYIDESKIGHKALSCVYIEILPQGESLTVLTNNINYCTADMYVNALTTAGITDARVMVSAPFPVSGTAALTGVYKAYEAIAGTSLNELAKTVGAEELVLTGDLAQYIGSDQATVLINELKGILDQTVNMTDEQVREEIKKIAAQYNISISEAQGEQILDLCRSLEKLDTSQLREKLVSLGEKVQKAGETKKKIQGVAETVKNFTNNVSTFFANIGEFFKNLFSGRKG